MINLSVDEAYAFDFLAILEIKKDNSIGDFVNYENCLTSIRDQVGFEVFYDVMKSEHYHNLVKTNQLVYDYIEQIRNGIQIDGKVVDDANMLRYYHKRALQSEVFQSALVEKKTVVS
jgi:pyridoxine/pyridoxamine 5'-phosphate oxidase